MASCAGTHDGADAPFCLTTVESGRLVLAFASWLNEAPQSWQKRCPACTGLLHCGQKPGKGGVIISFLYTEHFSLLLSRITLLILEDYFCCLINLLDAIPLLAHPVHPGQDTLLFYHNPVL